MKFKKLFLTLGLALGLGIGVGAGFKANSVKEANASDAAKGTISVDLTGGDWAVGANGQNISIYFVNETESVADWGSYEFAAKDNFVVFVSYNLTFTPEKMVVARYDGLQEQSTWEALPNRFSTKWNQTVDLTFSANSNILIESWNEGEGKNDAIVGAPYLHSKSAESSWNYSDTSLSTVKLNKTNGHILYCLDVTFTGYAQGEVKIYENGYGFDQVTFKHLDTTNWIKADGWFFKYESASSVSFTIVFDRNASKAYLYNPIYADADLWSYDFLGSGCSYTKENWTTLGSSWAKLDAEVRALFTDLEEGDEDGDAYEHAVARYDLVETRYGKSAYSEFMGREAAHHLTPKASNNILINGNGDVLLIVVISALSLVAVSAFFLLRKKKESK